MQNGKAAGPKLDGGGGAIYFVGGSVTVIDALFSGNRAAPEGPDVAGSAIYAIGEDTLTVVGSRFVDYRATNGGVIGVLGAGLIVVNTPLSDNRATGYGANDVEGGMQMGQGGNGGAISMDGQGRDLVVCGARFERNSSGAFGGAISAPATRARG
jgi:predicted outer membrane repeat protein